VKLFQKFFLQQEDFSISPQPVIALLYAKRPTFSLSERITAIAEFEPTRNKPKVIIEQEWKEQNFLLAEVNYDEHVIEIAGFPSPLPTQAMERTIFASPWSADLKELLQSHLLNIVLKYAGSHTDPIEQYISLYKVAGMMLDDGLLGIVNEPAWTCHPAYVIEQILEPQFLSISRQSPPLVYWTGFVRGQLGDEFWALSKGNYLFDVPDFAFQLDPHSDAFEINQTFHALFDYFYFEKPEVQSGDALQLEEDLFYLFEDPSPDYAEAFATPGKVYIIRTTTADDLNAFDDWNNPDLS